MSQCHRSHSLPPLADSLSSRPWLGEGGHTHTFHHQHLSTSQSYTFHTKVLESLEDSLALDFSVSSLFSFHHREEAPLNTLMMIQLIATPSNALVDEPVSIRATGLPPSQIVTIKATVKDENDNVFQSQAFYKTNEAGEVDLEKTPALGGDYVGVHPMGLFFSLKPKKAFHRLMKKDVMNSPLCICLDLYDSVNWLETVRIPSKASQRVQRWFVGPGVKREQIQEGRVRGALFLPPGETDFVDTGRRLLKVFFFSTCECFFAIGIFI